MGKFFLALKDHGSLHKASDSIVLGCLETENCFLRLLKVFKGKLPQGFGIATATAIASSVLHNCAHDNLFPELHNHQFHTTDDNHLLSLIKLAASCYTRIKLFHLGKQMTASVTGPNVRKQMSKLSLCKHQ